jgi:hypothetical protein
MLWTQTCPLSEIMNTTHLLFNMACIWLAPCNQPVVNIFEKLYPKGEKLGPIIKYTKFPSGYSNKSRLYLKWFKSIKVWNKIKTLMFKLVYLNITHWIHMIFRYHDLLNYIFIQYYCYYCPECLWWFYKMKFV